MKYVCLPAEWQNYLYHPINIQSLQTVLHRMTIIDTCKTDHGLAIRVKCNQADSVIHEKIVIISGAGDNISAEIADMETDRLPGHPENHTALQG